MFGFDEGHARQCYFGYSSTPACISKNVRMGKPNPSGLCSTKFICTTKNQASE
jgi:hypothetical protein